MKQVAWRGLAGSAVQHDACIAKLVAYKGLHLAASCAHGGTNLRLGTVVIPESEAVDEHIARRPPDCKSLVTREAIGPEDVAEHVLANAPKEVMNGPACTPGSLQKQTVDVDVNRVGENNGQMEPFGRGRSGAQFRAVSSEVSEPDVD